MQSIYDTFKSLHCGSDTSESWEAFKDWYNKHNFTHIAESAQLKWILDSSHIKKSMKKSLINLISKQAEQITNEKNLLLNLYDPEKFADEINLETSAIHNKHTAHSGAGYTTGIICNLLACLFVCLTFTIGRSTATITVLGLTISLVFYSLGIIVFYLARKEAKANDYFRCEKEAREAKSVEILETLDRHFSHLQREETRLYELNKVIVNWKSTSD